MSLQELSIGNDLKDQYKSTSKWINNGISWLSDIDSFYKERATIEQEYAAKLKDLTKRHFAKKAKHSSALSVGDEPQITPGSLESASVVLWNEVLTQTENIAKERDHLASEFTSNIAFNVIQLQSKCSNIAKHIDTIHEFLTSEKTKSEEEVAKAKKHYDSLCQSTENARSKTEKSSSDKYQQRLKEKEVDMNIGKNAYLICISQANRLKDKYYFQDLPEILDYYQDLNETRVAILNKVLKNASIIERNSNDKVKDLLHDIDATIDQNNPKLDVAMFIKHNSRAWKEPNDFVFEPCSFWHDDESLVTKEPELTDLKRRLNQTLNKYSSGKESTLIAKQKLEEVAQSRSASEEKETLKFDSRLDDVLTLLHKFMKEDSERVKLEVEIEIIQNFAGDQDMSYYEEAKPQKSRFGIFKHKKKSPATDQGSETQSLHTVTSNVTTHSGGLFSLRRKKTAASNAESAYHTSRATANYPYEASGDDEISLRQGESYDVVEEDDGSGWTTLRDSAGAQGLAPTSYLAFMSAPANENDVGSTPKKKGPAVAPKRGAKRVEYLEALYDYTAEEDNELTIRAGDKIVLVQADTDGSGWTEGEVDGRKGLFPTAYAKRI
ncbi:hypothetical protein CJJ07_001179 [Candidozyma auris]|nr:hypothetical protein CJJ07_001179 [[Candida] auris]QEL60069.1 hypothetical protein CJJ09_002159 [[Candida] auris]